MKCPDKCKYITSDTIIVYEMIEILYDVLEEHNGGLAHIVAADNNLDDESLKFVIEECNKEENKDRHDVFVCKVLCEALLRLNLHQRYFIYAYIGSDYDDGIHSLKNLLYYNCCIGQPNLCCNLCNFKHELNKFHAEQKCIEETGNNLKYLDGEWPIEDIIDHFGGSCDVIKRENDNS